MKKFFFLLAALLLIVKYSVSQYDDPNLDQVPPEFWDNISPTGVYVVVTDASGFDNFNIGTDFGEPHLVMNPTNPLNCFVAYNTNGAHYVMNGYDWSASFSPGFGVSTNGDPVTAFDSLGNLYYENMVGGVTGTRIIKSTNGGVNFLGAVLGNTGNDKNWMAADQTNGPYKNYVYTVMTPGNFKRSTDGGASFVQTFSSTNTYPGMMVCVGANGSTSGGAVYIVTNTGASAFSVTYNFFRSTDGGATFTAMSSQNFAGYVGTNVAGRHSVQNMRTRPYPMIAADNSYGPFRGRLYCVYATNNPAGNGNKPNIYCRYSTNQGTSFSSPILINSDTTSHQFFPAIWCDKTTGRLYCKWFDSKDTPTHDSMHVYASYSDNGGVTWATNQRITTQKAKIDCSTCGGGGTPRYQGDYDAINSNSKTAMMAWTDMRAGTFGSYTAYFPDFAMLVSPTVNTIHQTNDSRNFTLRVPAVKLYTDTVQFSATVSPTPAGGSFGFEYVAGNFLTAYPDSLKVKVKTIGTVTPGVYTITFTGQGPNGTPVHKRNVTLTVNSTAGSQPCEDFSDTKFPPPLFYSEYTGPTNFWARNTVSAYGSGTGSARFNFYSAAAGTVQSLTSNNFTNAVSNTYLTFDQAYAPFTSFGPDTLLVEVSSNFGLTYTTLALLTGRSDGTGELNTAPATIFTYTPVASHWRPKIYLLPVGTNKIRLTAKSGFGNNLYLDNICVQALPTPESSVVYTLPEGFYRNVPIPSTINDTARVYLHRIDFPNIVVDSATSIILSNAAIPVLFSRALSGSYYIRVNHRNSIETWSRAGGVGYSRGISLGFDFVNDRTQAYESNQAITFDGNYFAMYGGDINQDYVVNLSDITLAYNASSVFAAGYIITDVTGDNLANLNDIVLTYNNSAQFVSRHAPPGSGPEPPPVGELKDPVFKNEFDRNKFDMFKNENTVALRKMFDEQRNQLSKKEIINDVQKKNSEKKKLIRKVTKIYNKKDKLGLN